MLNVSIIVIGDELLIGQVTDTNSGWIARHINPLGWTVKSVRTVGDNASQIKEAITNAFSEADIVLTTGGLGPTKDDITKATLVDIFGGTIVRDPDTLANVLDVVGRRGIKINPLTEAQADVPTSCKVIQNRVGTAPIMWFENNDGKVLVAMPGVPFETEIMMEQAVIPQLQEHFKSDEAIEHRTLIVVHYVESKLAETLSEFEAQMPDYVKLAYLPSPGVIRLRLTGHHIDKNQLSATLDNLVGQLTEIIGDRIICYSDKKVEEILGDLLKEKGYTLATAESCTGGNIGHRITSIPGSSYYFLGGAITYSNEIKTRILDVDAVTLAEYGAVSEQTVMEMAHGTIDKFGANCAMATSGVAGPAGGSKDKPVGTVWISVSTPRNTVAQCYHFPGNRDRVIDRASTTAIIMLIDALRSE